jgi:ubiquitin carboxyl-terminal hydrolase 7
VFVQSRARFVSGLTNFQTDEQFEFPLEMDLGEFLAPDIDRSQPWLYDLHGVLVHSGGASTGRSHALIKPTSSSGWLKFEDELVTPVELCEVLGGNFGINFDSVAAADTWSCKRALMLMYIRRTAVDEVLAPVTEENVPAALSAYSLQPGWWKADDCIRTTSSISSTSFG